MTCWGLCRAEDGSRGHTPGDGAVQREGSCRHPAGNHSPHPLTARAGADLATAHPYTRSQSLSMSRQPAVSPAIQERRLHESVMTNAPLAQSTVVVVKPKPGDLQDNAVHQQTVPPVASDAVSLHMKVSPSLDTEASMTPNYHVWAYWQTGLCYAGIATNQHRQKQPDSQLYCIDIVRTGIATCPPQRNQSHRQSDHIQLVPNKAWSLGAWQM